MNKLLKGMVVTLILSLAVFTTCSLEGDILAQRPKPSPINPANKTFIVFDNSQGICTILVYDDYHRREEDQIAEIPADKNSEKIARTPGDSVPFYFSYLVNLKGINGFTLNYVPETGRDQKTVRIDADTTTTIKVPTLGETFSSPDKLLSNDTYLFIKNDSSFSFELHKGPSKIKPYNISSPLVNSDERAQYIIDPGLVSDYQLQVNTDFKEFPDSIINFETGHIYDFSFYGDIFLVSDIKLKLENVNTMPRPPAAPVVTSSYNNPTTLTLQWTAVENATAYEIWMSTESNSATAKKYGADVSGPLTATISGLINRTTYYIWLKAKNDMGTSGFSPVASGRPGY